MNATNENHQGNTSTLRVIAGFKLLQALLLVAAGLGALGLLNDGWHHAIVGWLDQSSLREGRRLTSALASKAVGALSTTTVERLVLVATGCFVYASVFVVEATGLWLRKLWAEYLTTIVTASLLPFEVMELLKAQSPAKIVALVLNLLVLGYLIWSLVTQRKPRDRA